MLHATVATTRLQPLRESAVDGVREAQLADSMLGPILSGKADGIKPSTEQLGGVRHSSHCLLQLWDQLVTHNGVLRRQLEAPDRSSSRLQTIVP